MFWENLFRFVSLEIHGFPLDITDDYSTDNDGSNSKKLFADTSLNKKDNRMKSNKLNISKVEASNEQENTDNDDPFQNIPKVR